MLISQAHSATHRPWPSSFHIPPRTLSPAPSANSTSSRTSIAFKRITPISSSCLHYSRIGSNGLNPPPRCVLKQRSAMCRRPQALPVPARYRLWLELFSHPSSYSFPTSLGEFSSRIWRNLNLFRQNYNNIFFSALLLSMLWNPNSIIIYLTVAFLTIFTAAVFLVVIVAALLALILVLIVSQLQVLIDVWLNVLVSLLIGVGIVVLHATFWKSEKKDDDFSLLEEVEAAAMG